MMDRVTLTTIGEWACCYNIDIALLVMNLHIPAVLFFSKLNRTKIEPIRLCMTLTCHKFQLL